MVEVGVKARIRRLNWGWLKLDLGFGFYEKVFLEQSSDPIGSNPDPNPFDPKIFG